MSKEITLEESKQIQVNILKNIDLFCRNNGINYSLAGGTLIGAVRHKGFIPWDDDIDLMMLREDYDRFIKQYKDDYYQIISFHSNKKWHNLFSCVVDPNTVVYRWDREWNRGIWVSIFPIDRIPDDDGAVYKMIQKVQRISHSIIRLKKSFWTNNTNVFYNITKMFGRIILMPFPNAFWCKKMEKIITSYNRITTKRYSSTSEWAFDIVFHFSADSFNSYVDLEFEGIKCMSCSGYDDYLRSQYGDYMKLPPEEERVPKHNCKMYYK